jgi:hypothetical protein
VQLGRGQERRVAVVDEANLRILRDCDSVVSLAQEAIRGGRSFAALIEERTTAEAIDYDSVYHRQSPWRLLSPVDHPSDPSRLLVSGTGLTHLGSAKDRHAMHGVADSDLTDSMRMFRWGVEGGRPPAGQIGIAPEWFYKGNGTMLRAHDEPLVLPPYGEDGGEEAEIAGVYLLDDNGGPWRIGMCNGNEFSDHRFEKRNYLNLASSKIRTCSLGPELVVRPTFDSIAGTVAIERNGAVVWSKDIVTGEANMSHSLGNMEHHHFKFDGHRRPGDVHVHYFGACSLSFGEGVELADGDVMQVHFDGFGRPLRNPLRVDDSPHALIAIRTLS